MRRNPACPCRRVPEGGGEMRMKRKSTTVYEGHPKPVSGYRVWHGWRAPDGGTGHVASFTSEEVFKSLKSALRKAHRYERLGYHTKITVEKGGC